MKCKLLITNYLHFMNIIKLLIVFNFLFKNTHHVQSLLWYIPHGGTF